MLKSDLKQRFELVYNFLLKDQIEISNLEEMKTSFCDALNKSSLQQNAKIILIYLVLLARYPSEEETQDSTYTVNKIKIEGLINQIILEEEFQNIISNSNQYYLKSTNSQTLYIDVSHTMIFHNNTGIQRVVRSLCDSYKVSNLNVELFKVDNKGRPQVLAAEDTEYFYSWNDRIAQNSRKRPILLNWLSNQLNTVIQNAKTLIITLESHYKQLKVLRLKIQQKLMSDKKLNKVIEIPLFLSDNQQILLPELCMEYARLQFYKGIGYGLSNISINMIIYDLIPVYYPEYMIRGMSHNFLEYLTLLRYATKVSCISEFVSNELKDFLKPISQKPIIEYHLLGDSKKEDPVKVLSLENNNSIPKILCVSTIDLRKNQINILRAAEILWEEGHIFELQFVGAMGLKSEIFKKQLETAERKYKVKYYKHVSDEVLNEMYKQAFFTIFVSHIEGFGLPILESLNHGKPCITSNNSSMKEIAEMTGGCLLVDPTSIEEISKAMKQLLNNKEKYQELKNQADNLKWHSRDDYAKSIYSFIMNES